MHILINILPNVSFCNRHRWRILRIKNRNIKKCIIFRGVKIYPSTGIERLSIGIGTFINSEVSFGLGASGSISIGDNCAIGPRVSFETVNHSKKWNEKTKWKINQSNQIKIGNRVWIGSGAIVLPNVEIGDDCVVCAGAVVTKSVSKNNIIGGVPAKVISRNN